MAMKPSKVPGHKAGPNGSFPDGDPKHARLAIGGATRSFNAGNIGKGTEDKIKADARKHLEHGKAKGPKIEETPGYGKAKGPKLKKKMKKSAEPDFAAGRSTSRTRSWGAFAGGQQAQPQPQAPGLGAGGAPQPEDDETPQTGE